MARIDIQKNQFVSAFLVIADSGLHRVTGIPDPDKIHTFHDTAVADIKTWNNPFCQHPDPSHSANLLSIFSPSVPLFSG